MNLLPLNTLLIKVDFRLSPNSFSRPQHQVNLIVTKLIQLKKGKFHNVLDVGGGFDERYRTKLEVISDAFTNLEIKKGRGVDLVGSVYKMPLKAGNCDLVTIFMVLEHLNEPKEALLECNRVLTKGGYLALTTVQYWHTHNYPNDYYRYTKFGLQYLLKQSGFRIINIWSHGGPFLVLFHVIELNLPNSLRAIYSICFYKLMDWLDWRYFKHEDKRKPNNDSVGWSVIAQKI